MPDEGFWFAIMVLDEVVDGRFQLLSGERRDEAGVL
jgi:hypothetical protein